MATVTAVETVIPLQKPLGITVEASGTLAVDNSLKAVMRVDAISGDRAIIARWLK